jgi:hypothetical protein
VKHSAISACLFFDPGDGEKNVPLKPKLAFDGQHNVIFQKTELLNKTLNVKKYLFSFKIMENMMKIFQWALHIFEVTAIKKAFLWQRKAHFVYRTLAVVLFIHRKTPVSLWSHSGEMKERYALHSEGEVRPGTLTRL